ncbi:MAG: hydantoinase/carbamoylase family amidase [Anaerolineales bacterium]|nr:hydantoinase/carbamoylase family amidase [Anaerolineales bacterium]
MTVELPDLQINQMQLTEQLAELASRSEPTRDPAAVTRRVFSQAHREGRQYLGELLAAAGIPFRQNEAGVLMARLETPGCDPTLPPIATGSHIDAIPESGRYDGTIGVLGGIAALVAIKEAGLRLRRPIELLDFAEEPTVFGVGCLPSRIMSGFLPPAEAELLLAEDGKTTFAMARASVGLTGPLAEAVLKPGHYAGWVELHIEQGPRLESAGVPIGIVSNISASATITANFEGNGGHAGAVMMPDRGAEALPAACQFANLARDLTLAAPSPYAVCTVGKFTPFPGASNSIPSRVTLTVDVRDRETAARDALLAQIRTAARDSAGRFNADVELTTLHQDPAAIADPAIMAAVARAAEHLGLATMTLPSFAYHDTTFMSLICPTTMIFVPSAGGHSHRPEEFTHPKEIAQGVRTLALTLVQLANE